MLIPHSGVAAVDSQLREAIPAVPLTGAAAESLTEASKEYVPFMPYLLPLLYPAIEMEPFTECMRAIGMPTEHRYMVLPEDMFDVGKYGRDLGLVGNALHLFPRNELGSIVNFIKSIVMFSETEAPFALTVQQLRVYDPFILNKQMPVTVYAIVVCKPDMVIGWGQSQKTLAIPTVFQPCKFPGLNAASLETLVNGFLSGDSDPLITTEKVHGQRGIFRVDTADGCADPADSNAST